MVGPGGSRRVVLGDKRDYSFPRLSPDGRRLAITMGVSDKRDVWLHEFGSGTLTRLTTEGTTNERPEWSPDGSRVLYRSDNETRTAIWWRPADLSARATPLLTGPRLDVFEAVLTPDARTIVYQLDTLGADIYYRALSGDTTPQPVAASTTAIETMPRLSPDGRWIAFTTDESGRTRWWSSRSPGRGAGYRSPPPAGRSRCGRGTGGGFSIVGTDGSWRRCCVRDRAFEVASRDTILTDKYVFAGNPHANYDVMPDGKSFVFLEGESTGT